MTKSTHPDTNAYFPVELAEKHGMQCGGAFQVLLEWFFLQKYPDKRKRKRLVDKGLAEYRIPSSYEIKALLSSKVPQKINGGEYAISTCEWCEGQTYLLHKHHFPISKNDGGEETVNICANCHYEYHHLESKKIIVVEDGVVLALQNINPTRKFDTLSLNQMEVAR